MNDRLYSLAVQPKVVPTKRISLITIYHFDDGRKFEKEQYYVHIIPTQQRAANVERPNYPIVPVIPQNGCIKFSFFFEEEQEYTLWVEENGGDINTYEGWTSADTGLFSVYALDQDLFSLRPYRGNMHIHSCRSDGLEPPAVVAAEYRKAGYDFIAITDHGMFAPSLEAIQAYDGVKLDMALFSGEEIHSPDNHVHIIHFAGDWSVNALCREHEDDYRISVHRIQSERQLPQDQNGYEAAASQWVFEQIQKACGLSILCHPNWKWYGAYNIPRVLLDYFLTNHSYDALELINGGNEPCENQLQVTAWYCSGGAADIPVVGNDDSHGAVNGKWFDIGKTYVLASSLKRESLLPAIRSGLCCAVEQYHGEHARIYGRLRVVNYFSFLHKEYFPVHDALCMEEGRLMAEYTHGSSEAAKQLEALSGQVAALWDLFFAAEASAQQQ